jgi:WD40 repeat protein
MATATARPDASVYLWDTETGKLHSSFKQNTHMLTFSPDGGTLVTCGDSPADIALWDVAGRKRQGSDMCSPGMISAVRYSPDGKTLATATLRKSKIWPSVLLWDPTTGKDQAGVCAHKEKFREAESNLLKLEFPRWKILGDSWKMDFSPDGKLLAVGGLQGDIQVWDVTAGKQLAAWKPTPVKEGEFFSEMLFNFGCHVAFSPDGKWLATGNGYAEFMRGNSRYSIDNPRERPVQLYEVAKFRNPGAPKARPMDFPGKGAVGYVGFTPDSQVLAAVNFFGARSQLHLWEVGSGKVLAVKGVGDFQNARISADGKSVVLAFRNGAVKLVDPRTGAVRETFPGPPGAVGVRFTFAPRGDWAATITADDPTTVRVFRLTSADKKDVGP